jgi:precorrin-2 dehydrogenase/sirohydrochlorin ferrochelatase
MSTYPVFLKLSGRCVVIIGGGGVAVRKAEALLATGANLRIVAKSFGSGLTTLCKGKNVELINSAYKKEHLKDATIVIAATNDEQINKQIAEDCRQLKILCNVVDVPELCDFFVPAVVKRGDLQLAISTEGLCPAYAKRLRKKFETIILPIHNDFLTALENARNSAKKKISDEDKRKEFLDRITADESFEFFCRNGPAKWNEYVEGLCKEK